MSTPRIDAIGIVSSDLDRTVAFYRALGYDVPDPTPEQQGHLVVQLGDFRIMIDTEEVMRSFDSGWQGTGSGRVTLATLCDSPSDVDRLHAELVGLGAGSHLEPFDAFWGQRYATVLDPDRVRIDLYAPLTPES